MSEMRVPAERSVETILAEVTPGDLTPFRRQASFDWAALKRYFDSDDKIQFMDVVFRTLSNDNTFARDNNVTLPASELRSATFKKWQKLVVYKDLWEISSDLLREHWLSEALAMYDMQLLAKYVLHTQVFTNTVRMMGTDRQREIAEKAQNFELFGCFALTEFSHGSNSKAIRSEAVYDAETEEFVLNSPDFRAAKAWVGNMGQYATHACVYLQLYTRDNSTKQLQCHGTHCFVVQIRDMVTLKLPPGVIVGDMGEKAGWNAVDNGWLMFVNYRVPRWCLLNRSGDVTADGRYVTSAKSSRERQSAALGALSMGRVGIVEQGAVACRLASVIVVRYSAARRQFGPHDSEGHQADELSVIEYQQQVSMSREMHAISSACKPLATWTGLAAVQMAREACGGHGFLKSSRLSDLRSDFDPTVTFEGENHVLMQQASNYLIALYDAFETGFPIESPFGSADFLHDELRQPTRKSSAHSDDFIADVLDAYHWLIAYLLRRTVTRIRSNTERGQDAFSAKNNAQVFHAADLGLAYAQHVVIRAFSQFASAAPDVAVRSVMRKLCELYAAVCLHKHSAFLYMGGFCDRQWLERLQQRTLALLDELRPECVALADVLAPPDFILNSSLGSSDGKIYERIFEAVLSSPKCFERPADWRALSDQLRAKM